MVSLQLQANVRKTVVENYTAGNQNLDQNARGDLCAVQSLPPGVELGRLGQSWSVVVATGAAFAPVALMPTILANIVLFNGEPVGGKSYIIDSVWAIAITSIGAASSITLLGQQRNAGIAAPTDSATTLITSRVGKPTYTGKALKDVANSAFALANKWTPLGFSSNHPSTAIGVGAIADVLGRFIIPPGSAFCANLVASTAGGTMVQGIDWFEAQLDMA